MEGLRETKKHIDDLEVQKGTKIEDHRNTIVELKELGVNQNDPDLIKRSSTFNKVLEPIESEIKNISEEISTLREDNNMQENPKQILEKRLNRLQGILLYNLKEFFNTDIGKKVFIAIEGDSKEFRIDSSVEISDLLRDYARKNENDILFQKEYSDFFDRDKRIRLLLDTTDLNLKEVTRV